MKLLNKNSDREEFKSFELNLLVETPEEARLLWHIFNRGLLRQAIITPSYFISKYIADMASVLSDGEGSIRDFIRAHVKIEEDK